MESRSRSKTRNVSRKRTYASRSKTPYTAKRAVKAWTAKAIVAPSVGLGTSALTKLKTVFWANVSTAASGVFTGYLKPGSCFDPSGDIAAMQPALYDQWSSMYGRYLVKDFSVTIKVTGPNNFVVTSYPSISSAALATYQGAASQEYSKSTIGSAGPGGTIATLYHKMTHQKAIGRMNQVSSDDNGGLTAADPPASEFALMPIFLQASSNVAVVYQMFVEIIQTVYFDRRINAVDA